MQCHLGLALQDQHSQPRYPAVVSNQSGWPQTPQKELGERIYGWPPPVEQGHPQSQTRRAASMSTPSGGTSPEPSISCLGVPLCDRRNVSILETHFWICGSSHLGLASSDPMKPST
eukprot:scaffold46609_cov65-Attheya_sp.AAC.3